VLSQEGRKVEALKLLRKAAKYEPMVEKVFIPQLERELQQESWENGIEFLWFWGNKRLLRPKLLIWSALVLTGPKGTIHIHRRILGQWLSQIYRLLWFCWIHLVKGEGEVCQLLENVMFHAELNLTQLTAYEF
jgi:hypothetical protein